MSIIYQYRVRLADSDKGQWVEISKSVYIILKKKADVKDGVVTETRKLQMIDDEAIALSAAALDRYDAFYDQAFRQCLSNGMYDRWGKQLDLTLFNNARELSRKSMKS